MGIFFCLPFITLIMSDNEKKGGTLIYTKKISSSGGDNNAKIPRLLIKRNA